MLFATWNVNSIRTRLSQVEEFLDETQPDLLCLQETKVEDKLFPRESIEKRGYQVSFYGQKAYNGVALISNQKLDDIRLGISGELVNNQVSTFLDEQKRIISALINGIRVVNVYVPNGSSLDSEKYIYKLKWLDHLKKYFESQEERSEPLCLMGDFNIVLEEKDIHNPKRFNNGIMASLSEREALQNVLGTRLEDVFRLFEADTGHWSWWDYRSGAWQKDQGWRIDHIYLSEELINNARSCVIHKKARGNIQPSDHAPVLVDINWPPQEDNENSLFY
ncbi:MULTISPECIES: exodeoxyribonuclease III [Prochlorococcus]|uniref:Exonuclease III n=1 Tax=Prochlorococcus marinus (strain SARG / CCMP1375 / SS120) TaxID=167539 RepID=Q7VDA0_PROMA|nr:MULTISPECIES: exodeoxyribonuclease III [Prochlorococcus]AAP99528.1 Exonuclease III [Prochlorococcus marinus subsp. marinus str. CCMP1375]KGG11199.1 Exodeoxyribonuclease III [Prochlorococcus marinus str. LG]KGG21537.1 Exodeoxyribonuclease III [Prochlorococcus marinus str. SS2]KGG23119.1 Exodeoxyribonuclease III [Prochlorococcus marinus str. SS35]KGG33829.1 Exodeoxyribonuclease III [Prochlorococcus marinus str. SS51]